MDVESLIASLASRGIRLTADGSGLIAKPASKLTDADRQAIRSYKAALLTKARAERPACDMAPDSRHPLICDAVRAKIEAIEAEARAKGWPAELLWNSGFWDCPRGVAAVLEPEDEIAEITPDHIAILKIRRDLLRFRRYVA